jgi:DNA adenine methylase
MNTAIKPILRYPGAKWSIARWITSFFPEHKHYLEPYCGSAAVFFNKTPAEHEILNDLNSSIINLFYVLREHGEELARRIDFTPWSEEEFKLYEFEYTTHPDPIENARRFLVRCWQAHGVRFREDGGRQGWKHNGMTGHQYPAKRWRAVPDRLLAVIDRLKDAEIRNRPALEMIAYYNDPECLIYGDPPYMRSTRNDRYYANEMTGDEHVALLNALDVHRGPVILSGYEHPLYTSRLSHWHKVTTPSVTEHGNHRTEVLWLNARAAQERQLPLFTNESEGVA